MSMLDFFPPSRRTQKFRKSSTTNISSTQRSYKKKTTTNKQCSLTHDHILLTSLPTLQHDDLELLGLLWDVSAFHKTKRCSSHISNPLLMCFFPKKRLEDATKSTHQFVLQKWSDYIRGCISASEELVASA